MENVIEAHNISKYYAGRRLQPAVEGLHLTVKKGQLYCLVGPDGAGKTTTLRILSTVMEQSSGSAQVLGFDIRTQPEKARKQIGYMPQNFSLYPDLSVVENLSFFADIHKLAGSQRKSRIEEMLAFTRLESFTSRRAGALSGGMKKKLALACALVHSPAVLLLDEPSTGVDPVSRRELWVILSDVVQQGVSVLVSTPYMDEAERCHQVGILYGGKMLISGTPEDLIAGMNHDIIEVKARPRKAMRQIISGLAEDKTQGLITDWRPVGDRLRLSVPNDNGDVERILQTLEERFSAEQLEVRLLKRTRPSMEDVFVHLAELQRKIQ